VDDVKRYYLPRFLDGENVDHLEFEAEMSGDDGRFKGIVRPQTSAYVIQVS